MVGIMSMHGMLYGLLLISLYGMSERKSNNMLAVLFFFISALVLSAKTLNDYGRDNWRRLATQNYFDHSGMFISVLVSLPLLLLSISILASVY